MLEQNHQDEDVESVVEDSDSQPSDDNLDKDELEFLNKAIVRVKQDCLNLDKLNPYKNPQMKLQKVTNFNFKSQDRKLTREQKVAIMMQNYNQKEFNPLMEQLDDRLSCFMKLKGRNIGQNWR